MTTSKSQLMNGVTSNGLDAKKFLNSTTQMESYRFLLEALSLMISNKELLETAISLVF